MPSIRRESLRDCPREHRLSGFFGMQDAKAYVQKLNELLNSGVDAIRISKKELANKMATALSDDQKLEGMFHRDQFRKWAEEYMKNYQGK